MDGAALVRAVRCRHGFSTSMHRGAGASTRGQAARGAGRPVDGRSFSRSVGGTVSRGQGSGRAGVRGRNGARGPRHGQVRASRTRRAPRASTRRSRSGRRGHNPRQRRSSAVRSTRRPAPAPTRRSQSERHRSTGRRPTGYLPRPLRSLLPPTRREPTPGAYRMRHRTRPKPTSGEGPPLRPTFPCRRVQGSAAVRSGHTRTRTDGRRCAESDRGNRARMDLACCGLKAVPAGPSIARDDPTGQATT